MSNVVNVDGVIVIDIVLNPPVSFPIIVNNARRTAIPDCGFALITNFEPVRSTVFPAVVIAVVSSSKKLVILVLSTIAGFIDTACGPFCIDTCPSEATSRDATVSSLSIAVYPACWFAPARFSVLGVTVADDSKDVSVIDSGFTLITGIPITSFGNVSNLYRII